MVGPVMRLCRYNAMVPMIIGALLQVLPFVLVEVAQAIPAWARKYDLQCATCHTRPPRLNKFGEIFHEMTFQLPMTQEQESRSKKKLGPVFLEKDITNNLAVRAAGNVAEFVAFEDRESDVNLAFPNEVTLFVTSNLTNRITLFGELEFETREVECRIDECEAHEEFGLGTVGSLPRSCCINSA